MNHESNIKYTFLGNCCLLLCMLWLSSCGTTKYLQEDQTFLKENNVKIISKEKSKAHKVLENDLLGKVRQKPNTNFFGINRRWFYYRKQKKGKLDKKVKPGKRNIYETPSIFNPEIAEETTIGMKNYLKERGYFHPTVTYENKIIKQQSYATYLVDPGQLFTVNSLQYISPDTSIQEILNDISSETFLQKGVAVSNKTFEAEKSRITNVLRNVGYREFHVGYIDQMSSETDTTVTNKVDISITVFNPKDRDGHQIYTVNKLSVYPYYVPDMEKERLRDTLIHGIHFYTQDGTFPIKPEVLLKRIYLQKGAIYSQDNFSKTVRNLGSLGVFKFANVTDKISQDSSNLIDFNIYLPANKKIVLGADVEISFSEAPATSGTFLGGGLSFSYRNRNLLRGSEDLLFNLGIGGEFGIGNSRSQGGQLFRTFDVNPQLELNIPKFTDPLKFVKLLNGLSIFSDPFYESLLENATTRIIFGVNWSQRQNSWVFFSGDLSLGYNIQNTPNRRYSVSQFGINFFNPNVGDAGKIIFDNNPFLERSFNNKQLFTGLLFRDFGMIFNGRNNAKRRSWRFELTFELSGAEIFLLNSLYNQTNSGDELTFSLFNLDFSKFAKLDMDGSFYKLFSKNHTLAFRFNVGAASAFGSTQDVPYVKQFFAGGPNSLRGWRIRELGPGSYQDPITFPIYSENSTPFYQTGDIRLLFSGEYRFNMFKVYSLDLEGALFIDGGNVWTIKEDLNRPGAHFSSDFIRQIALSAGFGFRMDFDYFKLVLDLGYKVRNPYPNPEGSYWAYQRWKELKLRGFNYNLSVGYPF